MTDTDTDTPETEASDGEPVVCRRDLLAAVAGTGVGAVGAAAVAQQSSADPQGRAGTPSNPLSAAHLAEIRGDIVEKGDVIRDLTDIRVAEQSTTLISPDTNTLVFRYDPNGTV
jgi:hypothetical protein